MSSMRFKGAMGLMAAGSLLFSSTAYAAAAPAAASVSSNPWASFSMMSGTLSATAMCGSAATLAASAAAVGQGGCVLPQVDTAPPVASNAPPQPIPVPPVEPIGGGLYFDPLLLGLGALALGALAYFLLIKKGNDEPNSPA